MEIQEILDMPQPMLVSGSKVVVGGLHPYPNATSSPQPPKITSTATAATTISEIFRQFTTAALETGANISKDNLTTTPLASATSANLPAVNETTTQPLEAISGPRTAPTAGPSAGVSGSLSTGPVSTLVNVLNTSLAEVSSVLTEAATYHQTSSPESGSPGLGAWTTATDGMVSAVFNATTNILTNASAINTEDPLLSSAEAEAERAELLRVALWQWMSPFIFLLGFIGNAAILIVLASRPVMSDNTTSTYVRCLAIADMLTLITGIIPEWLAFINFFNFEEQHPVTCKFYKFFAYTSSDASIWILAAFSVERFIAVVFPFKRQKGWCSVFQVKIICGALVLLGVAKNLQSFWTRGAEYVTVDDGTGSGNVTLELRSNCGYPTAADRYFNLYVRPWIVLVSINIVPMAILWFCNFTVIWTFSRRTTITQLQMSTASKRASALTQQVTIMCLCASFSFIVFMTPSFVLFCGKAYWAYDPVSRGPYLIAKAVNNQLMYINNSINFYLYLFSGERFRQSVISIFIKCQWKKAADNRSMSLRPRSSANSTKLTRTRRDPYDTMVVANNGIRLKACREVDESQTPRGSISSVQSSVRY